MNAREARRKSAEFYLAENYLHEGVKRWIETGDQNEILDLQDDLVGLADLYVRLEGDVPSLEELYEILDGAFVSDSKRLLGRSPLEEIYEALEKKRYVKAGMRSIPLPIVDELMGKAIAARAKQWNARSES